MANTVVRYDNKMNLLAFKNLDKIEASLFFSIVARFKDKSNQVLTLKFSEITEYLEANYTNKQIISIIKSGVAKIVQTAIKWQIEPKKTAYFTLFNKFIIDEVNCTLEASINDLFLDILNNFENGGFTTFELAEFSSLSSKYTQTLYRLLKQFKRTGYRVMEWGEFLEIMDIPSSYNMGTIDMRVINPSIKELSQEPNLFNPTSPIFKDLKYKKIRGNGRGRPVEKIEFIFLPQTTDQNTLEQAQKDLHYLATRDKQEQILKQIKKFKIQSKEQEQEPPKINPITGKEVDELYAYIGRHFSIKNKFDDGYDSCKICNLYKDSDGRIYGDAINQETGKLFEFKSGFDNIEHLKNALLLEG